MGHSVEAQVIDSHHLKLKKPIKIAPGSKVMITIEPAEGVAEVQEWYLISSLALEGAYSENEPDYSLERIKIRHERGGYHPDTDAAGRRQG
jgi:hypothetical protein